MPAAHHHLDDETLNAVLDGEATDHQRADASRCPQCAARLARLGQVASALGAPVSPSDPDRRRAALATARAAHDAGVNAPGPLALRRRLSPAWTAAAAVVLAGALAVPVVDRLGGNDEGREAATAGGTEAAPSDESGARGVDQLAPPSGEIDLTDLGQLAAAIARGMPQFGSSDPAAAPFAGRTEADAAALEQSCEQAARRRDPSLQRLAYAGEGIVTGRPAVVLAFEVVPPERPPTIRLLVLARDDCTELGSATA